MLRGSSSRRLGCGCLGRRISPTHIAILYIFIEIYPAFYPNNPIEAIREVESSSSAELKDSAPLLFVRYPLVKQLIIIASQLFAAKRRKSLEGMLLYCCAMRSSTSSAIGAVKCCMGVASAKASAIARVGLPFVEVVAGAEL